MNTQSQVRLQEAKDNAARAIFLAMVDNHYLSTMEDYWGSDIQVTYQHLVADYASKALGLDVCEDDAWIFYTNKATAEEINDFTVSKMISSFFPDNHGENAPVYVAILEHDKSLGALTGAKFHSLGDIEKSGHYSHDEIEKIKDLEKGQNTIGETPSNKTVFRII